jgi:hypothetical protein
MAGKQNLSGFNSDEIIRPIRHCDTFSIPTQKQISKLGNNKMNVGYHQIIELFLDVDR